jgi:hypothetical protein
MWLEENPNSLKRVNLSESDSSKCGGGCIIDTLIHICFHQGLQSADYSVFLVKELSTLLEDIQLATRTEM